jgi:dihydrofolate reductase
MSRIALVVAKAANGVIGDRGRIPWRISEDMRRFKQFTMGRPCVMGRKTWDSLPKKPLPGRSNIVVTRDPRFTAEGATVVHSLDEAIARARSESSDEIGVIGGEEIYRAALPKADVIYLTEVLAEFSGDAHFPAIDPREWLETAREERVSDSGLPYRFLMLERIHDGKKA